MGVGGMPFWIEEDIVPGIVGGIRVRIRTRKAFEMRDENGNHDIFRKGLLTGARNDDNGSTSNADSDEEGMIYGAKSGWR